MRFLLPAFVIGAFALLPGAAFAHALGASYETYVDGYHVDIGYSSPAPEVGESVIFDFNFPATQDPVPPYTDVWVRVEKERKVVFASSLHNATFGGPRMSYVFPEAGTYTLYARYQNDDGSFVEVEFPMTAVPRRTSLLTTVLTDPGYLVGALGVLVGVGSLVHANRSRIRALVQRRRA